MTGNTVLFGIALAEAEWRRALTYATTLLAFFLPGIVASLFKSLETLKGSTTMIVIEQFVSRAVKLADSVLVLSHGEVQHHGPAASFTTEMAAEMYSLHVDRADDAGVTAPPSAAGRR